MFNLFMFINNYNDKERKIKWGFPSYSDYLTQKNKSSTQQHLI